MRHQTNDTLKKQNLSIKRKVYFFLRYNEEYFSKIEKTEYYSTEKYSCFILFRLYARRTYFYIIICNFHYSPRIWFYIIELGKHGKMI